MFLVPSNKRNFCDSKFGAQASIATSSQRSEESKLRILVASLLQLKKWLELSLAALLNSLSSLGAYLKSCRVKVGHNQLVWRNSLELDRRSPSLSSVLIQRRGWATRVATTFIRGEHECKTSFKKGISSRLSLMDKWESVNSQCASSRNKNNLGFAGSYRWNYNCAATNGTSQTRDDDPSVELCNLLHHADALVRARGPKATVKHQGHHEQQHPPASSNDPSPEVRSLLHHAGRHPQASVKFQRCHPKQASQFEYVDAGPSFGSREFTQQGLHRSQPAGEEHILHRAEDYKCPAYTPDFASTVEGAKRVLTSWNQNNRHEGVSLDRGIGSGADQGQGIGGADQSALVLVSGAALSDLTSQIAESMNKMRDLEEQVRLIPELQRRLDHAIGNHSLQRNYSPYKCSANRTEPRFDSINNQMNRTSSLNSRSPVSNRTSDNINRQSFSTLKSNQELRNSNSQKAGYEDIINDLISLSCSVRSRSSGQSPIKETYGNNLTSTPIKTHLDCGCQSFKEHIRYNSLSLEQRLNHHQTQNATQSKKSDAATNTELSMHDILTRIELENLISSLNKTSPVEPLKGSHNELKSSILSKSGSSSISVSEPRSLSQSGSRTDSCEEEEEDKQLSDDEHNKYGAIKDGISSSTSDGDQQYCSNLSSNHDNNVDDSDADDEPKEADIVNNSILGEEPCSLGSSYQEASDFEEYCAYGESLDRRTKDFMSNSTKIPNDLRFALIRLNDYMKRNSTGKLDSSTGCVEVIRKEWFAVAACKESQAAKTKLYLDYFESFSKQLLNTVVNLTDSAGNTAMHYAASHLKMDIIKVLLDTKVCDVNHRNKAGYTPIMLLALADMGSSSEQAVARLLFSLGDVNIKARSSGQTALMLAASNGRLVACKLLLECGADPSLRDYDGSTALMCGSELGDEEVVRCLLAHKLTDPSATDNDGLDALTIAMNNGHKNIGLILYTAKNVPRMAYSSLNRAQNIPGGFYGSSLRRTSNTSLATNFVRRADSLLGPGTRQMSQFRAPSS